MCYTGVHACGDLQGYLQKGCPTPLRQGPSLTRSHESSFPQFSLIRLDWLAREPRVSPSSELALQVCIFMSALQTKLRSLEVTSKARGSNILK